MIFSTNKRPRTLSPLAAFLALDKERRRIDPAFGNFPAPEGSDSALTHMSPDSSADKTKMYDSFDDNLMTA